MGGGVCGAIFSAAGAAKLQAACNKLAPIGTGEVVITKGYNLPSKFIIHTPGPVYIDGNHNEEALLRSCYRNSLDLALSYHLKSIAFPLISTGIYGYPRAEAFTVASNEISRWLLNHDMYVVLVIYNNEERICSGSIPNELQTYIDRYFVDKTVPRRFTTDRTLHIEDMQISAIGTKPSYASVEIEGLSVLDVNPELQTRDSEDFHHRLDESFSVKLFRLIDAKGMTDVETYKRANIDRKLFSKIRSSRVYLPSKRTILSFAVALELRSSKPVTCCSQQVSAYLTACCSM